MDELTRLSERKKALKLRLSEGLGIALQMLSDELSDQSPRFNSLAQLKAQYANYLNLVIGNTLSQRELNLMHNEIVESFTQLVEILTTRDFKTAAAARNQMQWGELLYQIPQRMTLNKETECRVRVSYLMETIVKGWQANQADVSRQIRVAEIMSVELFSADASRPFSIRALSESVQFLDFESATEWLFYVSPLLLGRFKLLLKVSILEIVNGQQVRKDVVIEEEILVEGKAPIQKVVYKKSETVFVFRQSIPPAPQQSGIKIFPKNTPVPHIEINPKPAQRLIILPEVQPRNYKWAKIGSSTLAIAVLAFFILTTSIQRGFWMASYQDKEIAYARFIENHRSDPLFSSTPEFEKAYFRRAELSSEPLVVRAYLQNVPEKSSDATLKSHRNQVAARLDQMEIEAIAALGLSLDPASFEKYVRDFPEMNRLVEVVNLARTVPILALEVLPSLENAAAEQIRGGAPLVLVKTYFAAFPDSALLLSALAGRGDLLDSGLGR